MIRSPRLVRRDTEDGSVLVEFAITVSLFLLLVFATVDFARVAFTYVMAEKATERAVRLAVVRPALCPGVPRVNRRSLTGLLAVGVANGTRCADAPGVCQDPGRVSCRGAQGEADAEEIFAAVRPLLPNHATVENLHFSYDFDPALNRLGAPYSPIVTVDLMDLDFRFITDLARYAARNGIDAGSVGETFTLPAMSASLPAEDLS